MTEHDTDRYLKRLSDDLTRVKNWITWLAVVIGVLTILGTYGLMMMFHLHQVSIDTLNSVLQTERRYK